MEKLSPAIAERNIKRLCTLYNYQSVEKTFWLLLPEDFEGLKCLCIYTRNQELATFSNHIHVYSTARRVLQLFFFSEELHIEWESFLSNSTDSITIIYYQTMRMTLV